MGVMKTTPPLLFNAWKKLVGAYVYSLAIGFLAGVVLVKIGNIKPEGLYELSTKRLSYALPVFDMGTRYGIDNGVLLFVWNSIGALITMSFIYTAAWFDPRYCGLPPRVLRKGFCGKTKMKIFCKLPGCAKIEAEPLRRLYVWVMIPLLSIILLGLESGLSVSTATFIFGSFYSSVIALLPHGLIEIPTLSLAGAVTYSAHLMVNELAHINTPAAVFQQMEMHRNAMPIVKIALLVIGCLCLAGWVEAHITQRIVASL